MPNAKKSTHAPQAQIREMLKGEVLKPSQLLKKLGQLGFREQDVRETIAELLDQNAVVFDFDWRLQLNPAWGKIAA